MAAGTVLHGGNGQTLSVTFTPTDTTDYLSATASVKLTVEKLTPQITWASPAGITAGTALGPAQLDATANVPGTFVYTPAVGTVLSPGQGQALSVTFTPTDTTDYTSTTGSVLINVAAPTTTQKAVVSEQPLFQRKLKRGKPTGKPSLSGFTLAFGLPLNAADAANAANYQLDTITTKKVKKKTTTTQQPITNFKVMYVPASDSVDISFGSNETFPTGGQITVLSGVTTASGGTLTGNAVYTISKGGKIISPSS